MIPKVIHFCWLSGEEMPLLLLKCINSWKEVMPDYEIRLWDTNRFDIESVPFVGEACAVKKWAFAADYIRLYALYTEGGIYLDSDVLVKKPFDQFLNYNVFSSVEYHPAIVEDKKTHLYLHADGTSKHPSRTIDGIGIQAAVLGGIKGHPFIKECMDYYHDKHFILSDGAFNDEVIAPTVYALTAEKYGFKYADTLQHLRENMLILPSSTFASAPSLADDESFAIHYCAGSWRDPAPESPAKIIMDKLKSSNYIRRVLGKPVIKKDFN